MTSIAEIYTLLFLVENKPSSFVHQEFINKSCEEDRDDQQMLPQLFQQNVFEIPRVSFVKITTRSLMTLISTYKRGM